MFIQRITTFALFFAAVAVFSSVSGVVSQTVGCWSAGSDEAIAKNTCSYSTPGYAKCKGAGGDFFACCPAGATTTYTPGDTCGSVSKSSSNSTVDDIDIGASDVMDDMDDMDADASASSSVAIASITVVAGATAAAATIFGF
jgi:hypothetical protein